MYCKLLWFPWWRHLNFPRYWPFVRGIHRSSVNSPHKGQWRGALLFSFIAWINGWVNTREAGDLRHHRAHYDVILMSSSTHLFWTLRFIFRSDSRHRHWCPDNSHLVISHHYVSPRSCGYHQLQAKPGGRLNKKDGLTRYGDSHVKDKTS